MRIAEGIAYLPDELTARTIKVWFHTGQNHPMIQQRLAENEVNIDIQ